MKSENYEKTREQKGLLLAPPQATAVASATFLALRDNIAVYFTLLGLSLLYFLVTKPPWAEKEMYLGVTSIHKDEEKNKNMHYRAQTNQNFQEV